MNAFPFSPAKLFRSLTALITPMGLQASADELYRGAIFGRDSLRVALDLVPWFPGLAETVIFSLAHHQSTRAGEVADAYGPGQIPHEIRSRFIGPRRTGPRQEAILRELSALWGGSSELLVYYGSVDATPQFVRLVARYCDLHGPAILEETLRRADGTACTVRETVQAALAWLEREIGRNDQPLLGFLRTNTDHGHRWQVLQDGATSVIHADGHLANANARVETVGLQGLAHDALTEGAALFTGESPDAAARWTALASDLQAATLDTFWMPEESTFAMGCDRDPATGARRLIRTRSALVTELLETGIFATLPEEDRERYVTGIVRMAHGPDFLTPAGIRSRGLRHLDLLPYPDYHGALTCWGVTNSVYVAGLHRQGLPDLANDITCRHLGMLAQAGELYEFLYVDPRGTVRHPLRDATGNEPRDEVIMGTNRPEADQAWTLSFALREYLRAGEPPSSPPPDSSWQAALTREVAAREPLRTDFAARPELMRAAWLDRAAGVRHEAAYLAAER